VVGFDNLSNSSVEALKRVETLTEKPLEFIEADLLDPDAMRVAFDPVPDCVIHFAGLKAVGESVEQPLAYYRNNVSGSANLLEEMSRAGCRSIVFSSSATVYGELTEDALPIREDAPLGAFSPYGQTKLTIEYMLRDLQASDPRWNVSILRYFNPVGAHPSGKIGEDPLGIPNNLMPYISQVAVGQLDHLRVWGSDYPTPDGTCIRDYIHVTDLARGHLRAMEKLAGGPGLLIHNLGTGQGSSVLDVIHAFESANGLEIPYRLCDRRPGDIPAVWADPRQAERDLGWKAERSLEDMCRDAWNWQRSNPEGYRGRV
jgi:UDP-glucose 4-epimerase